MISEIKHIFPRERELCAELFIPPGVARMFTYILDLSGVSVLPRSSFTIPGSYEKLKMPTPTNKNKNLQMVLESRELTLKRFTTLKDET